MPRGWVVILADREDRGRALAEATRTLAKSRIVGTEEPWSDPGSILGVIADLAIDRAEARHCLRTLSGRLAGRRMPLIYLLRERSEATLREAERLGATACFSALTEPAAVAAALFRQIAPEKTLTDLLVEYSLARAATLFSDLFEAARFGPIDPDAVDDAVDPVLRALHEGGLRRWIDLVQAHDDMTVRHCLLVAGLAANFALHLGLSEADRTVLVRAALVHDVGKARIPVEILNKPGPLDSTELTVMRAHAALGHEILSASGMRDPIALLATRHHHEMLDGTGYPDRLSGDRIGDPIRLLTICDIYAALTERRPYRPAMPQTEALRILRGMAGLKLDPALVEAFAASLTDGGPSTVASAQRSAAARIPPRADARRPRPAGGRAPRSSGEPDMTRQSEEKARALRSAERLRRIADVLDLPMTAFFEPDGNPPGADGPGVRTPHDVQREPGSSGACERSGIRADVDPRVSHNQGTKSLN